jgi:hypothetical protein
MTDSHGWHSAHPATMTPHPCASQGNTDESELTEAGRLQALCAREALQEIPFDRWGTGARGRTSWRVLRAGAAHAPESPSQGVSGPPLPRPPAVLHPHPAPAAPLPSAPLPSWPPAASPAPTRARARPPSWCGPQARSSWTACERPTWAGSRASATTTLQRRTRSFTGGRCRQQGPLQRGSTRCVYMSGGGGGWGGVGPPQTARARGTLPAPAAR